MKIFLIIIAFLLFLTIVPFRLHCFFSDSGNRIIISFLGIRFYNSKKSAKKDSEDDKDNSDDEKKSEKNSENSSDSRKKEKQTEKKEKTTDKSDRNKHKKKKSEDNNNKTFDDNDDGILSKFSDMFFEEPEILKYSLAKFFKATGKLLKGIPFKKLYIKIGAGGEDAYEATMNYVFFNRLVWCGLGFFSSLTTVSKKKIKIYPVFQEDTTLYKVSFTADLKICNVLAVVLFAAVEYIKILNWIKTGKKPDDVKNKSKNINEKEFVMGEKNNKVSDIMGVTMEKIKEMVDVNTIIGEPVKAGENITIIPVSKVSYGFGSGGSDLPVTNTTKELFGGGAGAGVSIKPIGFIVVNNDDVKFIQVAEEYKTSNSVIDMIPGIVDSFSGIFSKDKSENNLKKNKKSKKEKKSQVTEETVVEE